MKLLNRLAMVERYFCNTKYKDIVEAASYSYSAGNFEKCEEALAKLPTEEQLLEQLMEKLKGKSVCTTLERIQKGDMENNYMMLKGLTSLMTHIIIECEQENVEFGVLIPLVLDKVNMVVYNL